MAWISEDLQLDEPDCKPPLVGNISARRLVEDWRPEGSCTDAGQAKQLAKRMKEAGVLLLHFGKRPLELPSPSGMPIGPAKRGRPLRVPRSSLV